MIRPYVVNSGLSAILGSALCSLRAVTHPAFVKRSKRDRYRGISSNPRLRHEFTNQRAHFTDFDPKYRVSIPSNKFFVDNIALELQKWRSPKIVCAISEDPALDQKQLPLLDAVKQIVGSSMGTVLSCFPEPLAFLECHDLLEKREYVRFVYRPSGRG